MGQIKNIKLHIVTDIKCSYQLTQDDHSTSQESQEAGPQECWSRTCREAQKTSERSRYGRWTTSSQNTLRQIPSWILRESWHAALPQDDEQVSLSHCQCRQTVVARVRTDSYQLRKETRRIGSSDHRLHSSGLLLGVGQRIVTEASGHRESSLLQ